jgi:hypothetical protein
MERNTTFSHERRRAGELRENEDTVTLSLASDVFERHEIHSVPCGCEKTHIGYGIQRCELGERNGSMHV